ncbi:hypothetical protein ACFU6K_03405 [Kitasatospora sp. NPDC057512]|uniref:hypothetical protein n=1 Tax=Kitasatospora sp. NPDC057512 TaxID=3346154 RepID=UPI003691C89E
MADRTCEIVLAEKPATRARELWKNSTVRRHVHAPPRGLLGEMAAGRERCTYCGDMLCRKKREFVPAHLLSARVVAAHSEG